LAGRGAGTGEGFEVYGGVHSKKKGEEGTPVVESCRKAVISQATYSNWRMEDQ